MKRILLEKSLGLFLMTLDIPLKSW